MKRVSINQPIWHSKSVGIAIDSLPDNELLTVEILAVKKDGSRYYPNTFEITVEEVKKFHTKIQERKGNKPMLYIVPIIAMRETKTA